MPGYSAKAQPFLDAVAEAIFASRAIRKWLLQGTDHWRAYADAEVLYEEQYEVRCGKNKMIQPFWANYWCGKDKNCACRIEGSNALESDAIFFLRNTSGRVLAMHLEFKHANEPFGYGQPEAYPLRGACFAETHKVRQNLNSHEDWMCVLICDKTTLGDERVSHFHRVITHQEASQRFPRWPASS